MLSRFRLWHLLPFAAFVCYAALHPAYTPLRAMLAQRFLETQGRADWQLAEIARREQDRQREIARIAEAERLKREAEDRQRRLEEETKREREVAEERQREEKRQYDEKLASNERRRTEIDEEVAAILRDAERAGRDEMEYIVALRSDGHKIWLKQLIDDNVSYEDIRDLKECGYIFAMTDRETFLCAVGVLENKNGRFDDDERLLTALVVYCRLLPVRSNFNFVDFIHLTMILRANNKPSSMFEIRSIDDVLRLAPFRLKDCIRARLTAANEHYLLNNTARDVSRVLVLKRERAALYP